MLATFEPQNLDGQSTTRAAVPAKLANIVRLAISAE